MLKITIQVTQDKNKESCKVTMLNPNSKSLEKATQEEKNACAMVINQITKALKEIQD